MPAIGLLYDRVGKYVHELLRVRLVEHVVFRNKHKDLSRKIAEIAFFELFQLSYIVRCLDRPQEHVPVAFVRADAFQE